MVEKMGRFGRFYACTGFPDCKHTESIVKDGAFNVQTIDMKCPKCADRVVHPRSQSDRDKTVGNVVVKKTKKGKIFYGCDTYPACDFATWDRPINEFCPTCSSILTETKAGKIKCSNKECKSHTKSV